MVISKAAPFATVVRVDVAHRAAALEALNTPADTVVAPVYVLAPDNIAVPAADLVNATEPAKIGDALTVIPVVGLKVNPLVLVNLPLPVIDPSVTITAPTESV